MTTGKTGRSEKTARPASTGRYINCFKTHNYSVIVAHFIVYVDVDNNIGVGINAITISIYDHITCLILRYKGYWSYKRVDSVC